MKKIFFVFAMLFMTVISALAEESTGRFITITGTNYGDGNFTIEGTAYDGDGLFLHGGNTITIKAKNGEKITRVECHIGYGAYGLGEYGSKITPNHGSVDYDYDDSNCTINNVNATSLVISSNITGNDLSDYLQIDVITVYYEPGNTDVPNDCVLTESFANGGNYLGNNVKVEGNANGLYIGYGKTVTVSPNNDNDVRIFKVDLEFSDGFNGTINSQDGSSVEGSGKSWTISNFYSSSLEISSPNSGQISNITVYYVKMSEKKVDITINDNNKVYSEADGRINVTGTGYGLSIDKYVDYMEEGHPVKQDRVTITSYYGVEISKVEFHVKGFWGSSIVSTAGTITTENDKDWTISDINSSSLTIYHPEDLSLSELAEIDRIIVYYKEPVVNSTMEVVANLAEGYYWTTFYSDACNYQAPVGTQVYMVSLNGTDITMIEVTDRIVNRCQGVVLKSTEENITMTTTDEESSADYTDNSLLGTSSRMTNPGNVYGLGYKPLAGVAFYKLKSTGTIAANKAYLQVSSSAAANAFFTFDFDATATGVDSINAQENEENAEVKIYDLQGRRVANPGKGIYIVNGKKVLMK